MFLHYEPGKPGAAVASDVFPVLGGSAASEVPDVEFPGEGETRMVQFRHPATGEDLLSCRVEAGARRAEEFRTVELEARIVEPESDLAEPRNSNAPVPG